MSIRNYLAIYLISLAIAMIFLDQSAVPIIIPELQKAFAVSASEIQWFIDVYMLALAALMIFGGRMTDLYGSRKIFLLGVIVFCLGSTICGLANTNAMLIGSRIVQGIGGAFMLPAANILILNSVAPRERGRVMGLCVAFSSAFLSAGPFIAGMICQHWSWRWVFLINLPLSLISFSAAIYFFKQELNTAKDRTIDLAAVLLLITSSATLAFGLIESSNLGWNSPLILASLICSISSGYAFIKHERRTHSPLINLDFFNNKLTRYCVILLGIIQTVIISVIYLSMYLQNVLHYTPTQCGILLLPLFLPVTFFSPIVGKMFDRMGPRFPTQLGAVLLMFSLLWLIFSLDKQSYLLLLPGLFLMGTSFPLIVSSCMASLITMVEPRWMGMASGIANVARQMGGALGLAVIGVVISDASLYKLHTIRGLSPNNVQASSTFIYGYDIGLLVLLFLALMAFIVASKLPESSKQEFSKNSQNISSEQY